MPYFDPEHASCCPTTSPSSSHGVTAQPKIYQAFIFCVPILFTFILLFLFYLFYLRRRRVDWASLRMRTSIQDTNKQAELGLKKELREMLPVIVYKESLSIRDTQCPVCLGEYQAEDRLQQIPSCGHTYHMDCINNWLVNHTTCPLCRLSLVSSAKVHKESPDNDLLESARGYGDATSGQPGPQAPEDFYNGA